MAWGDTELGKGAYKNPMAIGKQERKAQRQELKGQGLQGKELKQGMQGWKQETRGERAAAATQAMVPSALQGYVKPKAFVKKVLRGKEPYQAIKRIGGIEAAKELFGYNEPRAPLQEKLLGELETGPQVNLMRGEGEQPLYELASQYMQGASPDVDYMRESSATLPTLGAYARERLAEGGLTPVEEAAIRGRERGTVESGYREASRAEAGRLAAAGMDPRSGIAAQRALQLQRTRAGGLTDVERGITEQELARKQQIEELNKGVAGLEETSRLGDIAAQLRGREGYENLITSGAGLGEAARRFDVGALTGRQTSYEGLLADLARQRAAEGQWALETAEGGRQARMAREAYKQAGKAMEPGALDYTGAVLGGLFG